MTSWLCPLCGKEELPYGTTCLQPTDCGNKPHVTGQYYITDEGVRRNLLAGASTGIAQISNEPKSN